MCILFFFSIALRAKEGVLDLAISTVDIYCFHDIIGARCQYLYIACNESQVSVYTNTRVYLYIYFIYIYTRTYIQTYTYIHIYLERCIHSLIRNRGTTISQETIILILRREFPPRRVSVDREIRLRRYEKTCHRDF